jgi:hypothetical protein
MSPTNYGGALAILIPATDQVKKNPSLTESSLAPRQRAVRNLQRSHDVKLTRGPSFSACLGPSPW